MKRLIPLLLLLPALASAQDRGELAFNKACTQCHQAQAPTRPPKPVKGIRAPVAPAMDQVVRKKSLTQIHAWVQSPHRFNAKTACDTRLLAPDDLESLMSFLATVTVPAEPPRRVVLKQQREQQVVERTRRKKAEAEAKAKQSQSTNQGKK
ncbi:c-type cytochrome [Corallococcus sp. BB11-1]|uniref:c-type cytochrome n=1 Tax=Corallococcus sp. BB11-1 TaxID=2996783 RepID=UPI00226D9A6C|nr:c-type cytochrome [Corallococcus sp. BB11-1]MCY1036359.1 c-type cytochrome [Corallococcus sp. BB11-1]